MNFTYIPSTLRAYHYRARRTIEQAGKVWKCERCRSSKKLQVHHIDRNPHNNSLDNLEILCLSCHKAEHPDRLNFYIPSEVTA